MSTEHMPDGTDVVPDSTANVTPTLEIHTYAQQLLMLSRAIEELVGASEGLRASMQGLGVDLPAEAEAHFQASKARGQV